MAVSRTSSRKALAILHKFCVNLRVGLSRNYHKKLIYHDADFHPVRIRAPTPQGRNVQRKNTAYMYMPDGIRCNAIAPGGIATEISTSMGMPNMNGYNRIKNVMATAPTPGSPEQIASAALFLASDDSGYVNGDVLVVDGGWAAG